MDTPVKLVALDLDGTVLTAERRISLPVRQAVQRVLASGVTVTLATGRGFRSTQKYAQQLGLTTPLICMQGALVQDPVTSRRLLYRAMSLPAVQQLIELAETCQIHLNLYDGDYAYAARQTPDYDLYYGFGHTTHTRFVSNLKQFWKREAIKALFICPLDRQPLVEAQLRAAMPAGVQLLRTHHNYLEATTFDACKGKALAFLCDYLKILPGETLAIGDHENDLDMIQMAGIGVAMGNAYDLLKAHAHWIAPSVEEDGVAAALSRFVLNN